jgi:serine/threonine protein kinase/Tol biopolymer transport system component
MIGRVLSHYRILDKLGEGGMGEVYRARDLRLGRDVALKILSPRLGESPELLKRLRREAKILASLADPGIAVIHDIDEVEDLRFLVLEYVEGETLAAHLASGRLAAAQAIGLLIQVAEALEAAHARGVVHRDLKPANIMLQPSGRIKVLDFGLARSVFVTPSDEKSASASTTMWPQTTPGRVMGTVSYMSPEQARGEPVDVRADIWAFGCILFEALCGRRPFGGTTVSDVVAAVLKDEPPWTDLPADESSGILRVLRRCLAKDPERRYHHMADVRLELEDALEEKPGEVIPTTPRRRRLWPIAALMAVLGIAAGWGLVSLLNDERSQVAPVARFKLELPAGSELAIQFDNPFAISPDGASLALTLVKDGHRQLYLRALDRLEWVPLAHTEGGYSPFFSPDGNWLGFFADGDLKKLSLLDGTVRTVCEAPESRGATWCADGAIVFSSHRHYGLLKVSESGGPPSILAGPDKQEGQIAAYHHWPVCLPGCEALLSTLYSDFYYDRRSIAAVSLATGESRILVEDGSWPAYLPAGQLLFVHGSELMVAPFDLKQRKLVGPAVPLVQGICRFEAIAGSSYAVSRTGALAFVTDEDIPPIWRSRRTLIWVDRSGRSEALHVEPGPYTFPNLSPDGHRLAMTVFCEKTVENWVIDLDRGSVTNLTEKGIEHLPVWSPDGSRIALSGGSTDSPDVYLMPLDGSAPPQRLTDGAFHQDPVSWSLDGRFLVVAEFLETMNCDLYLLNLTGEHGLQPLIVTEFDERHGMISPDGHWLAYTSSRSGRAEVYVQPLHEPSPRVQVSLNGGTDPQWNPDGSELFYWTWAPDPKTGSWGLNQLVAVPVQAGDTFQAGAPAALFQRRWVYHEAGRPNYDVTRDGQRFIMLEEEPPKVRHVQVVLNCLHGIESH